MVNSYTILRGEKDGTLLSTFLMVGQQVLVLLILMLLGAIASRTNLIDQKAVRGMTNVVLYFVTPCIIVISFEREMDSKLIHNLLITLVIAVVTHVLGILLSILFIHDKSRQKQSVLRYGVAFSNCGFMSIPIEQALLGADGVFYGAVFMAVFNVFQWTYGLALMSGGEEKVSAKKLILNPGILAVLVGIVVFVLQIQIPSVLELPMGYMADLNTPIPMLVIGYYLGSLRLSHLTQNKKQYLAYFLRLILIPGLTLVILLPFHIDTTVAVVSAIAGSAPVAATTAMFATKFKQDAQLAAQMVSVSTLFSLVTIPLIVTIAQLVF